MKTTDFDYQLPPELIAYFPTPQRTGSRLMCVEGPQITHRQFSDVIDLLHPNDLLVMNNSKVIPARLFGMKETGGKVEILVERLLSEHEALVHMKASKPARVGMRIILREALGKSNRSCLLNQKKTPLSSLPFETVLRTSSGRTAFTQGEMVIEILGRENDLFKIKLLSEKPILEILEQYGHIPLPPYIERDDESFDVERYQTVYAKDPGSVAAPTAGLHFDEALLEKIKDKGVQVGFVTLHVGAGTFQPVRVDNIHDHKMHAEWVSVSKGLCDQIQATKKRGGRVIAVGTTSVRCLETASRSGSAQPFEGETDIFIFPGFQFQCVNAMITNFHLPKSSLLMLVSAFAGRDVILGAYQTAINEGYRFYSYGDAMFLLRHCEEAFSADAAIQEK